eukprot:750497-Hanusia_phi.AAC.3
MGGSCKYRWSGTETRGIDFGWLLQGWDNLGVGVVLGCSGAGLCVNAQSVRGFPGWGGEVCCRKQGVLQGKTGGWGMKQSGVVSP